MRFCLVAVLFSFTFNFVVVVCCDSANARLLLGYSCSKRPFKYKGGDGSERTWACTACTYLNPLSAPACGMCHQTNPNASTGAGGVGDYLSADSLGFPPGQEGVAAAMGAMGFPQYTAQLTDFGVESPSDLSDLQLLPDQDLIDEVKHDLMCVCIYSFAFRTL